MKAVSRSYAIGLLLAISSGILLVGLAQAAPPAAPKVSTFAPIEDVAAQIAYFADRAEKGVAEKGDFDDGAAAKLKKDGNTLAVLGLALGMHDGDHKLKAAAPAIVTAAQAVAASGEDYEKAKAAVDQLHKAVAGDVKGTKKLQWSEKVGDLPPLMHQVPLINNGLKKMVKDGKATPAANAANAATLAVIAQASMADTSEVKNPADLDKWYTFCAAMRDAAGEANKGLHANDKDGTAAAMKKLAQSCEDCHAVFRKEIKAN